MRAPHSDRFHALIAAVPTDAAALELRAMLLAANGELVAEPDGFVVTDAPRLLAAAWGRPSTESLRAVAGRLRGAAAAILCRRESLGRVCDSLPDWTVEPAFLHELPATPLQQHSTRVRALAKDAPLDHCTEALRAELRRALASEKEVLALFEDDVPVSFAYCPWSTETLEDVSVDTIPEKRRRGYAEETVRVLIGRIVSGGKRPIWGALSSNVASNALGAKLGFRRCGELFVVQRPV